MYAVSHHVKVTTSDEVTVEEKALLFTPEAESAALAVIAERLRTPTPTVRPVVDNTNTPPNVDGLDLSSID